MPNIVNEAADVGGRHFLWKDSDVGYVIRLLLLIVHGYKVIGARSVYLIAIARFFVCLYSVVVASAFEVGTVGESVIITQITILARSAKAVIVFCHF